MDYIKTLPLPPPRCRSAPHQLPPASAVCTRCQQLRIIRKILIEFCLLEHGKVI